jgi:uncharacterized Rossmann fold enzyme
LRFEEWESYYVAIVASMGYDRDRDEVVAYQLSSMLEKRKDRLVDPQELGAMIKSSGTARRWNPTSPGSSSTA